MDMSIFGTYQAQATAIAVALFAISEALSFIPTVKSNGIFQLIFNFLKKITGN